MALHEKCLGVFQALKRPRSMSDPLSLSVVFYVSSYRGWEHIQPLPTPLLVIDYTKIEGSLPDGQRDREDRTTMCTQHKQRTFSTLCLSGIRKPRRFRRNGYVGPSVVHRTLCPYISTRNRLIPRPSRVQWYVHSSPASFFLHKCFTL